MPDDQNAIVSSGTVRQLPWNVGVANVLAGSIVCLSAAWSLDLPRTVGLAFYPAQLFALLLGVAVAVVFLSRDWRGQKKVRPQSVLSLDTGAAILAVLAGCWISWRYAALIDLVLQRPPEAVATGVVIIILSLAALRRSTSLALVLIVIAALLYATFGDLVPGKLAGRAQDWQRMSSYLAYDMNGILGVPIQIASTVVVAFVLFGALLHLTGGARFFTDAAMLLMGGFRGGAMKIAVASSALFGSISGSAVANVMSTGVVTIPMIKRSGYSSSRAAAIEAVASTGGQLLPPVMGASAFLMAEFLYVPYSSVALAALIPGLLYYFALFVQADLEAARCGIKAIPVTDRQPARSVATGWHFAFAFAVLLFTLFWLHWQPAKSALAACALLLITASVFGYQGKRSRLNDLGGAITRAGYNSIDLLLICAAAGMVIGVLNITGLSFNLTYSLVELGGGKKFTLLAMAAVVCVILGMGLPTLGVYVLLATLVAPALIELGIDRIAAHLYVLYFGMMSMITPPVAIAAFAAAGLAKSPPMRTGFEAMLFGWTAYIVPVMFVLSPTLILNGEPLQIMVDVITAFIGVWVVSIALAGYFSSNVGFAWRILLLCAGLALMVPGAAFSQIYGTLITAIAFAVTLSWYFLQRCTHNTIQPDN